MRGFSDWDLIEECLWSGSNSRGYVAPRPTNTFWIVTDAKGKPPEEDSRE